MEALLALLLVVSVPCPQSILQTVGDPTSPPELKEIDALVSRYGIDRRFSRDVRWVSGLGSEGGPKNRSQIDSSPSLTTSWPTKKEGLQAASRSGSIAKPGSDWWSASRSSGKRFGLY